MAKKTTRAEDINRMSYETAKELWSSLTQAMKEVENGRGTIGAVDQSELYCELFTIQSLVMSRELKVIRKAMSYHKKEMRELLKVLYEILSMYHHYGACKGRELPGIAWTMEGDVFVLRLGECAVNMEHSVFDESTYCEDERRSACVCKEDYNGRLFAITYDTDIDCESGENKGHYEKALNFLCEFKDPDGNIETRDVAICNTWRHEALLRDTLAQLDVISEMMLEGRGKKEDG